MRGDFHIDGRLLLLAGVALGIGAMSAFVAVALLDLIRFFTNLFFFHRLSLAATSPADHALGVAVIAVPAIGGIIVGLMARYGSEKIRGHGIPEALEAILYRKSVMQPKVAVLKPLSSAIAIGSGGPFGAEGPIIMTGGAVGSLIGQALHLSAAERKTLLVAGACGGMTAVFGTPAAAILLAVELLLFEWRPKSLIPVAVSSITAEIVRGHLLGLAPLFPLHLHVTITDAIFGYALVVGLVAGSAAALVSLLLYKLEDLFHRLPVHWMWWPAIGGVVVGIGGYFQPRAFGVGYDVIADVLQGNVPFGHMASLAVIKSVIWVVALASSTSGGVLAPLLLIGASLGGLEAGVIGGPAASAWPLLSMAAMMGGMMRAPFTAVVFALELSQQVALLPALLTACVAAYTVTVLVMKRSILTEKIARRGLDIFREYTVDPMERFRVEDVMTRDVIAVPASASVSDALRDHVGSRKHRGYPVMSEHGRVVGVVMSDNLAKTQADVVANAMSAPALVAHPKESCRIAAERMALAQVGRLPVVSESDGLVGIITRSDLLKARRAHHDEERAYERVLAPWRPRPQTP